MLNALQTTLSRSYLTTFTFAVFLYYMALALSAQITGDAAAAAATGHDAFNWSVVFCIGLIFDEITEVGKRLARVERFLCTGKDEEAGDE